MSASEGQPELEFVKPATKQALKGSAASSFAGAFSCDSRAVSPEELICRKVAEERDAEITIVDGFLSKEECARLCMCIDESPALSFWSAAGRENDKARAFRDADTIEVDSQEIAKSLWRRIERVLAGDRIEIEEDGDQSDESLWERELPGVWKPVNFNHDLLFVKYPSNGAFSPHTDGKAVLDFNNRSFYSVIIFLNDIQEDQGGGTRFYRKEALDNLDSGLEDGRRWTASKEFEIMEVEPKAGRLLFFDQRLVHEGVPPQPPFQKYIIRSDIIYSRDNPVCDSPQDREAYNIYGQAETLAEGGDLDQSISLFKKALRMMSPDLRRFMGQ